MFKPTYLYVKTHNQTGLKYFGKTSSNDPYSYKGSGLKWARHIKVHGYDVTTTIIGYYTDEVDCKKAASDFCEENDVVSSPLWANLKLETLDGGFDHIHTKDISKNFMIDRWKSDEYRQEMKEMTDIYWTPERRQQKGEENKRIWTESVRKNMSERMRGNKNTLGMKFPPKSFVTNDIITKGISPEDVEYFLLNNPEWRRGMKRRK